MVFFVLAALADYYSRFGVKFLNWGPGYLFLLRLGVTKTEYVNSPKSADSALLDFQLSKWLYCTSANYKAYKTFSENIGSNDLTWG